MITIIHQENIMKHSKTVAALIITSFLGMNINPAICFAASENKKKNKEPKNKVIKSQISEYRFDYVNTEWWKGFNDEYLNDYILKAIENNHDLKIATLRVEQYHQMMKLQFANELPQVSAGFSPTGLKLPGTTSTSGMWAFPVMMSYELDLFLKNRDKTRSSKKEWEKSKFDERASYIAISSAVGATYFNIIRADKLIELQKEIINDRKQIFDLMAERNAVGLTSTADLVSANKAYIAATADLSDLEKTRMTLLNNLAVLIGENPDNAAKLQRKSYDDSYLVKIPESIPSEVIDQRPDYLAAEKMVEKAGIDVRVAKKEFLPSINLIGLAAFGASSLSQAFNWSNMLGLLGGSAMLNLFTGGKKVANLKLKKNVYEQILHDYYNTNLKAIQEVNDSLVSLKQDDKKYKTNRKVFDLEKTDFSYSEDKYNAGLISYLDLLQRRENLLSLNKQVVSNKIDCNIDYIGLYKATGTKL